LNGKSNGKFGEHHLDEVAKGDCFAIEEITTFFGYRRKHIFR